MEIAETTDRSALPRRIYLLGLLQIPLILIAFATISYVGWRVTFLRTQLDSLKAQRDSVAHQIEEKQTALAQAQRTLDETQHKLDLANADLSVTQLAVAAAAKSQPKSATLEYFPKGADGHRVETALRQLGFKFTSGNPKLKGVATNTIFYGSKVEQQELKLVASALVQGNIGLKAICTLRNSDSEQNRMLIEIGAMANLDGRQSLTEDAIMTGQAIPKNGHGELLNGHMCVLGAKSPPGGV